MTGGRAVAACRRQNTVMTLRPSSQQLRFTHGDGKLSYCPSPPWRVLPGCGLTSWTAGGTESLLDYSLNQGIGALTMDMNQPKHDLLGLCWDEATQTPDSENEPLQARQIMLLRFVPRVDGIQGFFPHSLGGFIEPVSTPKNGHPLSPSLFVLDHSDRR